MVSQVISAILVCKLWQVDDDLWTSAIVVAFLVLHPYQAELYTWKIGQLNGGVPFVMTFAALIFCTRGVWQFAIAVLVIAVALGIHQIPLEMASAVLVLGVPIVLVRGKFVAQEWWIRVLTLGVGLAMYVVTAKVVIADTVHAETIGRDKIILLSSPGLVLARSRELLSVFALRDPLTGWLARAIIAGLAALCVWQMIVSSVLPLHVRAARVAASGAAVVCAFLCAVSLTVVPQSWLPAFRNVLSVSAIWGAIAAIAFAVAGYRARKLVAGSICMILLGFVGSNNEVMSD